MSVFSSRTPLPCPQRSRGAKQKRKGTGGRRYGGKSMQRAEIAGQPLAIRALGSTVSTVRKSEHKAGPGSVREAGKGVG